MLPSSTVENYLKAIYQHQVALPPDQLVPMGQIATALGVAPGTATTMVKTLAESGLVLYEPYSGVRLAAAGERLAALVLRRHRLVELFLVEIMGMSWAEVHDEAEKLEHVVSDRLIERMDEMLGHPTADPHGDPIPSPEGTLRDDTVRVQELQTLLTCPLNTPVTVARISDQDAAFLRFIETHNLKPGQAVEVEARDAAADAVRIRGKDDRQLTIGTRAASKLLVQLVRVLLIVLAWNGSAWAQSAEPFAITDNSFLIEEAFNQAGAQTTQTPSTPERTTAISGYMDFHFNKQEFQDGRLDFHRFVLLITHSFSDRIRFVSELELEHALVEGLEEAGELELEQAYVDFLLSRRFNVRAGMMLMPIGIINERHEPPVYYGVERPFVDTVIIPTTWFEVGAGVHGEVGRGWRYRVFVASPLNAREFSAEEGLRGGRQKGADTNIGRPAITGRLEYVAVRGLTLGASFWTGRSGFEFRPRFDVPVKLGEADVRYSRDRLELRGQFAQVAISNAGQLNDAMGRAVGVDPNVASALRGFYGEAGYRVISGASYGDVGLFARYEDFDTQFRMPADYLPLREFDRDALVFGLTYWPDPDIALKFDYSAMRSRNSTIIAPNSFNVGLGWWF